MSPFQNIPGTAAGSLGVFWAQFQLFFPKLLGFLAVLIFGWLIAKVIAVGIERLLKLIGVDSLSEKAGTHDLLQKANIKKTVSEILARIIYWIIILIVISLAMEALGLNIIGESLNELIRYIPNVLIAAVLVIIGTLVANFVHDIVATAAASTGITYGRILAKAAHHLVLLFVILIALSQLGLDTGLITDNVTVIIAGIMGIAVLAVGLGGRSAAANLIGAFYAGQMIHPGDKITIGEWHGTVKEVSTVSIILETKDHKRVIIPAHKALEENIEAG